MNKEKGTALYLRRPRNHSFLTCDFASPIFSQLKTSGNKMEPAKREWQQAPKGFTPGALYTSLSQGETQGELDLLEGLEVFCLILADIGNAQGKLSTFTKGRPERIEAGLDVGKALVRFLYYCALQNIDASALAWHSHNYQGPKPGNVYTTFGKVVEADITERYQGIVDELDTERRLSLVILFDWICDFARIHVLPPIENCAYNAYADMFTPINDDEPELFG